MTIQRSALYPMRLVMKLTGLTSDTIRAWERRYRAIEPERTAGNTRQFSAEDVRRLTLLRELTSQGHAISAVAGLDTGELSRLLAGRAPAMPASSQTNLTPVETSGLATSEAYLGAITRFETARGLSILRSAAERLDTHTFVFSVVVPIIQAVGQRWSHGELGVAQEHMVSAQLTGLLGNLRVGDAVGPAAPRMLLCAPAGHRHELGLIVSGILAQLRGLDSVYLGSDLPWQELDWAVQMSAPKVLVLSIVRDLSEPERKQLEVALAQLSRKVEVWIGCPANHGLAQGELPVKLLHSYAALDEAITGLGATAEAPGV